ncbi:hypothetical protein EMPG_12471 [Blastomyces silverae]|uniref:Uncharacterized protein n=1 Tax=Blastomyces silverae TaxID=2060906 RepID=A0A0H1BN09_9EURO|nr:hypothetical protein EMPG_12471 [Blastomyces silverae]
MEDTWLSRKERFVHAWIDKHFHLNKSATSIVESAHWLLKNDLETNLHDLNSAVIRMERTVLRINGGAKQRIEKARLTVGMDLLTPLFRDVARKISPIALNKVKKVQADPSNHHGTPLFA